MLRISHRDLYQNVINSLNQSTVQLQELNLMASSQKKVNKPSDDPAGSYRILGYRDSLNALAQYRENIKTAKGWLSLADESMMQMSNLLIRARELTEQASTGTMSGDNREQISYEARELFKQMVSIANSSYEGKSIFAGHKTDANAFESGLYVNTNDSTGVEIDDGDIVSVSGNSDRSILVQFTSSGNISTATYDYSTDGGRNWSSGAVAGNVIDLGGVQVEVDGTSTVTAAADHNDSDGTWLWVRPAAYYQGDDNDTVQVDQFGSSLTATAAGSFAGNVLVRIDNPASTEPGSGTQIEYSYSLDGGKNWTTGNTHPNTAEPVDISVPGGFLNLTAPGAETLETGHQFVIRPSTAKINVEVSAGEEVQVNGIGKDMFGGLYNDSVVFGAAEGKNLMETLGKLVGYLETNNQDGIQQSLENLKDAEKHLMNQLAAVGARENRVAMSDTILQGIEHNEKTRLSELEDVDVAELMTELASQQLIYQSVLKSSSMIMRMSLVNYI